jgi:Na+-translocating ferredoxin:NAD+ oxidoreductase RNF subunit RnfB
METAELMKVLYSFISVAALGILLGIGLAIASRLLHVKKDKRLTEIEEVLPGLNCGACGYAGCASYAEAIVEEEAELTKCTPGGGDVTEELGRILGITVDVSTEKKVAQVHCRGGRSKAKLQFEYKGVEDCNALFILYHGDKECKYGCLGLGSCIQVCPVEAIDYDSDGLVWVNRELCVSCGKCITVCPTGVMQWQPYNADLMVACNSTDKGGIVKKYCEVGCIGCKLCEKKSPEGGFYVENFLAKIDYSKDGDRLEASEACPTKCIIRVTSKVEEIIGT